MAEMLQKTEASGQMVRQWQPRFGLKDKNNDVLNQCRRPKIRRMEIIIYNQ
jgi:hypothetical protein